MHSRHIVHIRFKELGLATMFSMRLCAYVVNPLCFLMQTTNIYVPTVPMW